MNSIQNRILFAVLVAVVIPLTIIFLVSQTLLQSTFQSIERSNLEGISSELSRNVSLMMEGISSDLEALSTNPLLQLGENDEQVVVKELKRQVSHYTRFADISLYNMDALLVHSTHPELEPTYRDYSPAVKGVLKGETVIHRPSRKPGAEGLFVKVYLPLKTEKGEVTGFIKARVAFDNIANYIAGVEIGQSGEAVLLDEWGNLIAHRSDEMLLSKFDSDENLSAWVNGGSGIYTDHWGVEQLYSAVSLDQDKTRVGTHWTLVCQKPMSEAALPIRKARSILLAVLALSGGIAFVVSSLLSRKISRPLVAAGEVSKQVAAGDLDVAIDSENGPEEIRRLAVSFNAMVDEVREHRDGLELEVAERTKSLNSSRQALSETSAQLHAAFESTREAILLVDNDGVVLSSNGLFAEFFGFDESELIGRHVAGMQPQMSSYCSDVKGFLKAWTRPLVDNSLILELEYSVVEPCARTLAMYSSPIRIDGKKISGRLWTWRDLTEQRTLEQSLRQSQKMEAIGQLAGGVAHDFNNLLTGIVGNLALVEMQLEGPEHDQSRHHIEMAGKAGVRAAELIKQLLGFSRRSHLKLKAVQANEVVGDVRDLLTASINPKVKIQVAESSDAWPVMVDPTQLEQVVMNMCVNAKDALMRDGGTITISTANTVVDKSQLSMHADAKAGDYLCITVEDNGEGMPAEVRAKIFEPFFTTKEQGKGTGLGLATSFGIIKQLGGWITCDSTPGVGTRFCIYLPKTDVAIKVPEKVVIDTGNASEASNHTLLLVDDEVIVRSVAETLLKKLGYNILVAGNGEDALRIYEERGDEIDLVMLDLTMPVLSGQDTFRRLREEYDYVPVLICSGYLVDLTAFAEEAGARPDGFVQKPYNMDTMATMVREVINQAAAAA